MVERSLEEERLEKMEDKKEGGEDSKEEEEEEEEEEGGGREDKESMTVSLGPKVFDSSKEMFDYYFNLLRHWSLNLDINEYEHMVLLDILQRGHPEPDKKIGEGIRAFQVRYRPAWKSRCFFIVWVDGADDDFSFRKCIDQILPSPEHMKAQSVSNGDQVGRRQGGNSGRCHGRRGGRISLLVFCLLASLQNLTGEHSCFHLLLVVKG
ncbi:protein EMBRYO DEFECTIVE 514-like isoform X2 [Phoenix dactylifera]|uniref:Protein EMBRYO DEFECTIVE 514-like isoform X2 n=1 Tax=Phoenix dactylifera TaxID=42345 RepID=A0A8B9AFE7_PHODC|nr:protein EMBRYO DEFECTIVE 514-like isoform X2 [Phoenix dactylifera]